MLRLFNSQPVPVWHRFMRRIAGDVLSGFVCVVTTGAIAGVLQVAGVMDFFDFIEPWAVLFSVLLFAAGVVRRPSPPVPPVGTAAAITAGAWRMSLCFVQISPGAFVFGVVISVLLVRLGRFAGEAKRRRMC